jgi:protein Mpv17
VDLLINAGVLSFVLLGIFIKVATVDMDLWRGWYPEEILLRVPRDNWEQYMSMLTAHPVIVKGFTSFSVYALGDVIAQGSEGRQFGAFDRLRLARSALAGLIGHGPLSHFWYEISERAFDFVHLNGMWWSVFPKVAVDQLLWGPIWNGSYIVLLGLMKQNELKRIAQDVYDTSLPLVLSGLKLWPFAHLVTYGLVPIENRLLWVDTVEIMWVMILSRQAASQAKAQDKVEDKAQ